MGKARLQGNGIFTHSKCDKTTKTMGCEDQGAKREVLLYHQPHMRVEKSYTILLVYLSKHRLSAKAQSNHLATVLTCACTSSLQNQVDL
jgi:hypothetical protein